MTRARSPSPDTNEVSASTSAEEPTTTSPAPSGGMSITRFQFAVMGLVLMSEALCTTMLFPFVGLFVARLAADGTDVSTGAPPMGNATAGIHQFLNGSVGMPNITGTVGNSSTCGGSPCAGVTEDGRSSAGYYAGLLVGMFQLSQFCFAPRWGRLGDIIGRKPVFMTGLILSGFVVLAFGCSQSILMAMIIRFIHGGVNANASVAKTYVAEVSTKEAQAKLFGMMSLSWSLGAFIGPSVGGILYDPANSKHLLWMGVSQESFLGRNPALLPCAFAALYSWSVCILCAIALKESNPKATGYAAYLKRVLPQSCVGFFSGAKASESEEGEDEPLELQDVIDNDEEGASPMAPPTVPSSASVNITVGKVTSPTDKSTASDDDDPPPPFGLRELAHHSVLRRVIPMYMLLCGYNIMFNEGLPLYAIAYRQDEGLGMSSGGVGVTYTMNATVAVIANSQFGRISKMISHLRLWRICNLTFCVVILCYPMLTYIVEKYPDNNIILFGLIGLLSIVRTSSSTWCFSVCMMFVANAAPPRQLGAVTGLGHGCGALSRAFIPIAAAPIFAWSISQHHPFPYNHFLIFELAAVLAMIACAISLRLSDEDVSPRDGAAQQGGETKSDGNGLVDDLDSTPSGVGDDVEVERRGLLAKDSASSEDE